jgi:hypothetical protein
VAGPLYQIDLSVSTGADEPYGPFGWGLQDVVNPFANYPSLTYTNLTGYSAVWTVRTEDNDTSTLIAQLTSASGAIVFSSIAAEEGPAAPSFVNAFSWSMPNATSSGLTPGNYYHSMWLTSGGGLRSLYLKGIYTVLGAQ